jgi:hypothetical protein
MHNEKLYNYKYGKLFDLNFSHFFAIATFLAIRAKVNNSNKSFFLILNNGIEKSVQWTGKI